MKPVMILFRLKLVSMYGKCIATTAMMKILSKKFRFQQVFMSAETLNIPIKLSKKASNEKLQK